MLKVANEALTEEKKSLSLKFDKLYQLYEAALRENARMSTFISEGCYFRNKKGQIQKCK
jgi:hypothetical protein